MGILIFIFYDFIAAYEEKLLEKKLGQDYREYKKEVPRWFPR
jgi:protein-S-isoprenylcysteine O-methyltransferase Ste14